MITVYPYDAATGIFSGRVLHTNAIDEGARELFISINLKPGQKAYRGTVGDIYSHKVDVDTGLIVDHQPPAPCVDHEWNADTKRWQLGAAFVERSSALARIAQLEASQSRAIRELMLASQASPLDVPAAASEKLQAIDDEIAQLRKALK